LEECIDCRNFTVRDALRKIFNGSFRFVVLTPFNPTERTCKVYSFTFSILGDLETEFNMLPGEGICSY
jgi:hypothetical protein